MKGSFPLTIFLIMLLLGRSCPLFGQTVPPEENFSYEQRPWTKSLGIRPHNPNYLIPVNYDFHQDHARKRWEAKFQLSIKKRIVTHLIQSGDLYVGYTQQSFWQVWDQKNSRPFRESNYAPEVFLTFPGLGEGQRIQLKRWRGGLIHESNGKVEGPSRSWNRAYLQTLWGIAPFFIDLKLWVRIPEKQKNDDNPDILHFMGPGELQLAYQWEEHVFTLRLRNNLHFHQHNHGAYALDWTYPINGDAPYLYLQLFHGYGEGLMDYNRQVSKIGIGVMFNR